MEHVAAAVDDDLATGGRDADRARRVAARLGQILVPLQTTTAGGAQPSKNTIANIASATLADITRAAPAAE